VNAMALEAPWIDIAAEADIPLRGARRVMVGATPVGIFRAGDGAVFALVDRCPHKNGPLTNGIVHGRSVACPLHNMNISLETGRAPTEEEGCTRTLPVAQRGGRILIDIRSLNADGEK
jgi:nitrite reductase (NADH) small subunit